MADRLLLLAMFLSVTCPPAWAQDPAGAEFRVNSYTTGYQRYAAVASAADGNFVVVWESLGPDGSAYGISGQRFNAAGLPQGSEFTANSFTTGIQLRPEVASDANGNFVVVWESDGQDGSYSGVFGQRFGASGLPQGIEFKVNSFTSGYQIAPSVASDANGNVVVVWQSYPQDGSFYGIFGQRFNAAGLPQGSEFPVNTFTPGNQLHPAVAFDANGNFVVVWDSRYQDGSVEGGVFGRRFNASGVPQGTEFRVNSYTTGFQIAPSVATAANGSLVVAWQSTAQDGNGWGIFAQRFNAAGLPQGSEFRANTYIAGDQYHPTVASDANGNFVVAWDSFGQDGSGGGVFGRRFNTAGFTLGSEFRVNSYTTSYQFAPAVASAANGNFVVVWSSYGQDGSSGGIFGQRFGDLIFQDGFE